MELSKIDMYKMYYEVLTPAYKEDNQMQLLYTDTDSLIISIRSKNLEKDLAKIQDSIDFSNFCPENPLYDNKKAAKLGCIKIEMAAHKIICGVFLKAKVTIYYYYNKFNIFIIYYLLFIIYCLLNNVIV